MKGRRTASWRRLELFKEQKTQMRIDDIPLKRIEESENRP